MSWLSRAANVFRSAKVDRALDEETAFHIDSRVDELVAAGMRRDEAAAAARRQFGNRLHLREASRDIKLLPWLDDFARDVRHGVRALRHAPVFASVAILTLALGIGATTAIFSVVNAVLIKPLPYRDSDTLVRIAHSIGGIEQRYFADGIFLTYAENTRTFQDVGVWTPGETAAVTGRGEPEEVRVLKASRSLLTTLDVRPQIGRWFSTEEDAPGAPDVVILTSGYWQARLGRNPGVLERVLTINGRPHQVIGVMPPDFRFDSENEFEIVLPLKIDRAAPTTSFRLLGVARLKPDVTLDEARADAVRVLNIWFEISKMRPEVRARWRPAMVSLKQDIVGDIASTLWALLGAIGIVLLMACANVANLLLMRGTARREELALRSVLGATWTRIASQLLVESLVLALLGAASGVSLAYLGLRGLKVLAPANVPRISEVSIDLTVLSFAVSIAVASGMLFALMPVVKYARPQVTDALGASRTGTMTRDRQRSQQTLVAAQLALALVLLVGAGLMSRSFEALRRVVPGFTRPEHVQTFTVSIPVSAVPDPVTVTRMQQDIVDRAASIPGVAAVAFTTRLPMGNGRSSSGMMVEGGEAQPARNQAPPNRQVKIVSPGSFRTLGTPLLMGRDFEWTDVHNLRDVTIVSENLARELFGSADAALGRRIRELYYRNARWKEIVGVAGDVHDDGVDRPAPATVYWPVHPDEHILGMEGYQARRLSFVVRSERAQTAALLDQLRTAVHAVSATLPLAEVRTLDEVYRRSMARTSLTLVMLATAATMAVLLAISGIYGVTAYAVSQRRREVGIRQALGAQATEIRWLFLRRSLTLVIVGTIVGLSISVGVTRLIQSLLFGTSPVDPIAFAATSLLLAVTAMLASYVPIRHALASAPLTMLKES
jgi:predicted permease